MQMDAREYLRRWDAAIERYHQRRPEDERWRQRANAALAKLMARVQELEEEAMADDTECRHEHCEVSADNLHAYCCECGKDMDEEEEE